MGLGLKFLLVFLLDDMVHIVEHQDFMPEDYMLEEEAASSAPRATNLSALGAAATVHSAWQHTPPRRPGHLGLRLGRCQQQGSCYATLQAPRPLQVP
jgi:hypothetical protein